MELWENLENIASIYQVWLSCQFSQLMLFDQVSCHVCHPLCVPNKNSREENFNKNSLYTYLQRLAWKMYENIGWIWQFVNAQSDFWLSSRRWCQIRAHLRVVSNIGVSYTVHAIHNVKRNYVTENVHYTYTSNREWKKSFVWIYNVCILYKVMWERYISYILFTSWFSEFTM